MPASCPTHPFAHPRPTPSRLVPLRKLALLGVALAVGRLDAAVR